MELENKKVTVVGLGKTAMSLVRLLLREGAEPWVTEADDGPGFEAYKAELTSLGVACETGGHTADAFSGASLIVPSPGVSPGLSFISDAARSGVTVQSELELAYGHCRGPVIAVTGTNGKTTTTEMVAAMIRATGRNAVLAGNNATPFSTAVLDHGPEDVFILEVSSYQLELVTTFHPWIAAILNVSEDHLERHGSMERYAAVKARLFSKQGLGDHAVVNENDPWSSRAKSPARTERWPFSATGRPGTGRGIWVDDDVIRFGAEKVASVTDILVPGRHNLENALAAMSIVKAGDFEWSRAMKGLRGFKGVRHRIEHIADIDGVEFYNDSKSTNLQSLRVALESFTRPIVLIAGGRGKGGEYEELTDLVADRVSVLVAIGEDKPLLERAYGEATRVVRAEDMRDAVLKAAGEARRNDVVLLSPACASFDMFDHFEHRGDVFRECVKELALVRKMAARGPKSRGN